MNALLAKSVKQDEAQQIAIEASISNNALLIDASFPDFQLVNNLVAKLDQAPEQVLVEVLIAEVSLGKPGVGR